MLLDHNFFVFLIPFLGLFFLFGELFVKIKGVGAILGLGFIAYYFSFYLDSLQLLTITAFFLLGLGLVVLDGKLINDGTLGVIGLLLMIFIIGFTAPGWVASFYSSAGVVLGSLSSLFLLKIFPKRNMWSKIALNDQLTSEAGYNSLNDEYKSLLGERGITKTVLRPTGTIVVNEEKYSAVSEGKWIEMDKKVEIVQIEGTRIVVKEVDRSTE